LLIPLLAPFYLLFKPLISAFDVKPENIDVREEKLKMKKQVTSQVLGTLTVTGLLFFFFYIFSKASNETFELPTFYPILFFAGAIMVLCVTGSVLKYFVLKYKAKSRR